MAIDKISLYMAIPKKIEQHKILWHDSVRSFRGHDVCMYYIVLYIQCEAPQL